MSILNGSHRRQMSAKGREFVSLYQGRLAPVKAGEPADSSPVRTFVAVLALFLCFLAASAGDEADRLRADATAAACRPPP